MLYFRFIHNQGANRNDPLRDSSGILTISENGDLLILNGEKQVVWSTHVSHIASNSSAQFLDSGNLVPVDGITGAMMGQSFQHPCETLLQDMKLILNPTMLQKYSCGSKIILIGVVVDGMVQTFLEYLGDHVWLEMDSQGRLEERRWNFQKSIWEVGKTTGDSECDVYGKCGPSGICNKQSSPICSCLRGFEPKNKEEWERQNWPSCGYVRIKALQCEISNNGSQGGQIDGFLKLESVNLPDHAETLPDNFIDTIDCQAPCLKNCSCKAYAYEPGLGCMVWNVDLVDLMSNSPGGVDLYLLLASSEQGPGKRNMKTPTVISVLTGTILIIASGFFLWKKWPKQKGDVLSVI
ncbi:G-type lectin S-receptor-like serine/threonine-protein kinase At1g11300 [Neltuma alba]|uniref:G-type lectin S-receptor-like serine/threonine-protein kinase At1g11300 n=1 Tax=Neltuma alba TaxID=207710 RepID=UPI0010A41604|nr:G-type lectin S-receptor-like serine/threonine-protein kinase At1g11300 [Prosopis alba]